MSVILLSGWKRSGKGTVAEYLEERHGYQELSLAEPIKDLVSRKYNIIRSALDDQTRKEAPIPTLPIVGSDSTTRGIQGVLGGVLGEASIWYWTPRALCILEGSMARAVDPQFWTRELVHRILQNPEQNYVVSDVRYRSEVEFFKARIPSCRVVRISREYTVDTLDASERDLDEYPFDAMIQNRGTKEELYAAVDGILPETHGYASIPVTLADGSQVVVTGPGENSRRGDRSWQV